MVSTVTSQEEDVDLNLSAGWGPSCVKFPGYSVPAYCKAMFTL